MKILLRIVLNGVAILVAAFLIPGIRYGQSGMDLLLPLLLAGFVLGAVNLLVKPLVVFLSLPFIVLTLGLFYLAINGLMLMLTAWIMPGLTVDGCFPAILGGLVIGIVNWVFQLMAAEEEKS